MFDQLFKRTAAIDRHTKLPLYAERVRYLGYVADLGAANNTLKRKACALLHIQAALQLRSPAAISVSQIQKAADRWVRQYKGRASGPSFEKRRRAFISLGIHWMKFLGWLEYDARTHPNADKIRAF
jgi:integrase/recombinase XerD